MLNVQFSKIQEGWKMFQLLTHNSFPGERKRKNGRNKLYKNNESGANLKNHQLYFIGERDKSQYNLGMKLWFNLWDPSITPMSSNDDHLVLSLTIC